MLGKVIKHLRQGSLLYAIRKKISNRSHIYCLNINNLIKYGPSAPRFQERIWVNPEECTYFLDKAVMKELLKLPNHLGTSGRVVENSWPVEKAIPLNEFPRIRFCIERWVKGKAWGDTGVYKYMEERIRRSSGPVSGCKTMDDIVRRYENLDLIYEQVKQEGRFRTEEEIDSANYREGKEIFVHIGPGGEPFLGGGGRHRFAMAYILKIPFPAKIDCVHVSAIPYLNKYRKKPDSS